MPEAAFAARYNLAARLAVVPLVLEARRLDITPAMIAHFRDNGDDTTAKLLEITLNEEIGHVAAGLRWFQFLCRENDQAPVILFQKLVRKFYLGWIKRPFNEPARQAAGFSAAYYGPLVS